MPSLPGAAHSCSQAAPEGAGPSGPVAACPLPALPPCQLLRAFSQVASSLSPPWRLMLHNPFLAWFFAYFLADGRCVSILHDFVVPVYLCLCVFVCAWCSQIILVTVGVWCCCDCLLQIKKIKKILMLAVHLCQMASSLIARCVWACQKLQIQQSEFGLRRKIYI